MGLLYAVLGTYMMPPVALILPLYMVFSALGLLNSVAALIIVYCTILLPFVTWLLKATISTPCPWRSRRRRGSTASG